MNRVAWSSVSLAALAAFAVASACRREAAVTKAHVAERADAGGPREPVPPPKASVELPNAGVVEGVRYIAFGGGSDPASNQISLAQDLALFQKTVAGPGLTLFASGPRASVAVERKLPPSRPQSVGETLARILGQTGGELLDYQPAPLTVDGPATSEHVLSALGRALTAGGDPLLVYGATHGEQGSEPNDNALMLWGGWDIDVRALAELLDRTDDARPTRFVLSACFGGGFADLVFSGANPARGAREADHCGVFAAPWDDEASGCDPSPDRRAQESFTLHFLHALAGEDRRGAPLPASADIDGDGRIGLLDAHAFARVASHSFDIPTTTSERFLRSLVPTRTAAPNDRSTAPEDAWVADTLGEELGLTDERAAHAKLAELEAIGTDVNALVEQARAEADDAYFSLRIALLERWPLLAHPWEERALASLHEDEAEIARLLLDSDLSRAYEASSRELEAVLDQQDSVRIARARVVRLVRAFETVRLASALKRRGGAHYQRYERLRSCERYAPPRAADGAHASAPRL